MNARLASSLVFSRTGELSVFGGTVGWCSKVFLGLCRLELRVGRGLYILVTEGALVSCTDGSSSVSNLSGDVLGREKFFFSRFDFTACCMIAALMITRSVMT